MEKTTAKTKKKDLSLALTEIFKWLRSGICAAAVKVGRMSFWRMALLCLALRLFVVAPLGAAAAAASGCVWAFWNLSFLKEILLKGLWALLRALGGHEQQSVWFEHEGRDKIRAVVSRLSEEGVNYCDLAKQLDDLPPENQWYAICSGLSAMGIIAQASHNSLYITWHLPHAAG